MISDLLRIEAGYQEVIAIANQSSTPIEISKIGITTEVVISLII
ncbi:hypothetical protein [Nostoc sp.]